MRVAVQESDWFTLGDARSLRWPDKSIQSVVTSSPYWGQRYYGVENEIGLERCYADYLAAMVEVASEIRRCLTDDGSLWLNIGDTFNTRPIIAALRADGWYLRADVIWSKPWCTPENAPDRPSRIHEYLFLLTPNARYQYDKTACPEGHRSVWEIAPGIGTDDDAAIMPDELVRRCVLLTTRPGDVVADPFAGSGTVARVARSLGRIGWSNTARSASGSTEP